ncbi:DNA-binding protein [Ideonella sp. DXS29W]|uniref:DNA-binding protein n=1 Tax=Ideonella lacteola TaxID=2984193 RepID=A0ABU9BY82_9BURK
MSDESEILAEVDALKARFSDTKALYREVCALLFFRYGITPTTNKLYQYVRKGTMSTPAEALAKFWDELRAKARVEVDHPDLPSAVKAIAAEAIAGIWRQSTDAARNELAAIRVELQADQERTRDEQAQAQQAATQALATIEQLRLELAASNESAAQARTELEAERRAHSGAMARLHELQTQLDQARAQQHRQQEAFSADLSKAGEAVQAADRRAAATEKRALMEIERERQARSKADKLVDTLRGQLSSADTRERQVALEHVEATAKLQAKCDGAVAAELALRRTHEAIEQELRSTREQLLISRQEATRYRAEAQTVQALLDRIGPPDVPTAPAKATRKKTSSG